MDIISAPQSVLSFQRKPQGDACFFPDEEQDSHDLPLVSASEKLSNDAIENTSITSRGLFQKCKSGLGELRASIHSAKSLEVISIYCSEEEDCSSSEETSLNSLGDRCDDASLINFNFPIEDQNSSEIEDRRAEVEQDDPSTHAGTTSGNGEMSQYEENDGLQLTFDSAGSCQVRPLTLDSADLCQVLPLVESVVLDKAKKIGHSSVISSNQKPNPRHDRRTSEKPRDASSIRKSKASGRHSRGLRRTRSAEGKFSQIRQGSSRNMRLVKPVHSTTPNGSPSPRRRAASSNDLNDKNRSQRSKSTNRLSKGMRRASSAEGNILQMGSSSVLRLPSNEGTQIAALDVVDSSEPFPNKRRPVGSTRSFSQSSGLDDKNRSQRSKSTNRLSKGMRRASSAEGNILQMGSSFELRLSSNEGTQIAPLDVVDPSDPFPNNHRPVGSTRTPTSLACGAKGRPPLGINSTTQQPNTNTNAGWVQKDGILVLNR